MRFPKSPVTMSSDIMFVLFYVLFIICIVHPPVEIVSAGFTIPAIFERILGNENIDFIKFHIRRTALTLLIYSLLPLFFILGLNTFVVEETQAIFQLITNYPTHYSIFTTVAIILPILALVQIYNYKLDFEDHPIVKTLKKYINGERTSWEHVATEINNEYRRIEKVCIKTSSITTVIATENWIIKILPLNVLIAHQNDARLTVEQSDTHSFSQYNPGTAQYLTIKVKCTLADSYKLRLNALDFQELQTRVARSINIMPEITFHRSVVEQFVDAFKDVVKDNVAYIPNNHNDERQCIGCMQNQSNIKLVKTHEDTSGDAGSEAGHCTPCYCRPMWCIDCLATWFAHRQDANKSDTWLSSKCTCPTCRATFCILDVCPIARRPPSEDATSN